MTTRRQRFCTGWLSIMAPAITALRTTGRLIAAPQGTDGAALQGQGFAPATETTEETSHD